MHRRTRGNRHRARARSRRVPQIDHASRHIGPTVISVRAGEHQRARATLGQREGVYPIRNRTTQGERTRAAYRRRRIQGDRASVCRARARSRQCAHTSRACALDIHRGQSVQRDVVDVQRATINRQSGACVYASRIGYAQRARRNARRTRVGVRAAECQHAGTDLSERQVRAHRAARLIRRTSGIHGQRTACQSDGTHVRDAAGTSFQGKACTCSGNCRPGDRERVASIKRICPRRLRERQTTSECASESNIVRGLNADVRDRGNTFEFGLGDVRGRSVT